MEARAGQLVGQRLACHRRVGSGLLAFVEASGLGAVALSKVCSLHEYPGQILVAVTRVTFAFLLAVACVLAAYAPRIRSKVSGTGKAFDRADLEQDDRCQSLADARHGR